MDFEQAQVKTGFRLPFQYLPNNNNTALKLHIPLGFFFSPFNCESNQYQTIAPRCTKCGSVAHPYANKNKSARRWTCSFCATDNALMMDVGNYNAEEYVEAKSGQNGIFFVLDLTMAEEEFEGLKSTILKTIDLLPRSIYVGLIAFGRSVYVYDFSQASLKFHCFNGHKEYTPATILEQLGIQPRTDPRKMGCSNYYALIDTHLPKLKQAIECLEADSFPFDQMKERQQRATGCALNILVSLLETCNINTRIALAINGPCTVGPGRIVDLPLIQTLRTWKDITEDTANNKNFKAAKKFYDGIEARLTLKHTLDLWAFGLDQYGLVEMKDMVTKSGGLLAMHELFNHFIFDNSFTMHYQANQQGLFNFPIAAKLAIYISKDIKVKGLLGYGKSLKDDKLGQASEMETGEGKTSVWYIGGVPINSALAFILANAELSKEDLKSQTCVIQIVTQFKYSDNIARTKVSTISRQYFKEQQIKEVIRTFDQKAAIVLLARMASHKADVQQCLEVKTWLDRTLLKFTIRFAQYNRYDIHSFRLQPSIKLFPQYAYHLRRSNIINTFNCSPDQSIFKRTCLMRECIENCIVMIQPALLMYTSEKPQAQPAPLDIESMKEDVVLLLDSYFDVLIWYGQHIYAWKTQKLNEQEDYAYLNELFSNPVDDSSSIIYDRIPVSNFYETFKGDGKQRYLKARVNPSTSNTNMVETGNFLTDDAPIKMFMDFLIKQVVNYSE